MSNTILGIIASSGGAAASTSSYESIATVAGNSGTSVTFNSIPSGYVSLQVRYYAARDSSSGFLGVRFNSDTGSNYADHYLYGTGATVSAAGGDASNTRINYVAPVQDSGYSYKASGILDIYDYSSTTKYKTTRGSAGLNTNSSASRVWLSSGLWMSTSAITSITFDLLGDTFATSSFSLYGIKG
jgi:hypothetical protein